MFIITEETWKNSGVEVIVFNDKKWLHEKHIEEQLKYRNLREGTSKYPLYLRKKIQELQKYNKQLCKRFLREDFAVQIIMDCRTTPAADSQKRLGFNQKKSNNETRTINIDKSHICIFS